MAGRDYFDISPRDREVVEFRASRRNALRQEYLQLSQNPYRQASLVKGAIFDEQLQRMYTASVVEGSFFLSNIRSQMLGFFFMTLPPVVTAFSMVAYRNRKEMARRTGQVSYKDRWMKFV